MKKKNTEKGHVLSISQKSHFWCSKLHPISCSIFFLFFSIHISSIQLPFFKSFWKPSRHIQLHHLSLLSSSFQKRTHTIIKVFFFIDEGVGGKGSIQSISSLVEYDSGWVLGYCLAYISSHRNYERGNFHRTIVVITVYPKHTDTIKKGERESAFIRY